MEIISCSDLNKIYAAGESNVQALQGINCNFQQGEFCAITGPSGSGKSTLLHVLGGLEYPTSGQVFLPG